MFPPHLKGGLNQRTRPLILQASLVDKMGDFGVGVGKFRVPKQMPILFSENHLTQYCSLPFQTGLYFHTLKFFSMMCFIAGCINIPNMIFFSSDSYEPDQDTTASHLAFALRTSAVCEDTSWEPCPTCTIEQFSTFPPNQDRLAFAHVNGKELPFIHKNNCSINGMVGYITILTILFISASLFYFVYLQQIKGVEIDHSMQTSRDYSVEVEVSHTLVDFLMCFYIQFPSNILTILFH